jgi:hypothetical protein
VQLCFHVVLFFVLLEYPLFLLHYSPSRVIHSSGRPQQQASLKPNSILVKTCGQLRMVADVRSTSGCSRYWYSLSAHEGKYDQ